MNIIKRGLSVILSGALLLFSVTPTFAAEQPQPSAKEEVVYATLNPDGSMENAYVVNSFSGGNIVDYGKYSRVKILNTSDTITQRDDEISCSTSADKIYYQGDLEKAELPWIISLKYLLDGKEIKPEELAGKEGNLTIHFNVSKNSACSQGFYEDYALQASLLLDTNQCTNIIASDATIANVGRKKQLTYTILPGKGIDTTISARITDFEMEPISINGIRLNLSVDVDDKEIKDKVNELMSAINQLDSGANALYSGSTELKSGASQMTDGASRLHSGVEELDNGVVKFQQGLNTAQKGLDLLITKSPELKNGSKEFQAALHSLQEAVNSLSVSNRDLSQLAAASGQINKGITDLSKGAEQLQQSVSLSEYKAMMAQKGLDLDALKAQNAQAIAMLQSYDAQLKKLSNVPGMEKYKAQLEGSSNQLKALLMANTKVIGGSEAYIDGVSKKLPELTNGLANLQAQYEIFNGSIIKLVDSLGNMTDNLSALSNGINQLASHYDELNKGIEGYTDGVAQLNVGYKQLMEGFSSLAKGSKKLASASGELYDGTIALYDGVASLCDGAGEMADGTGRLKNEVPNMQQELEDKIDSLMASLGGDKEDIKSFTSDKNTNVQSVQFALQTKAIQKPKAEHIEQEKEQEPTPWQKFTDLFSGK